MAVFEVKKLTAGYGTNDPLIKNLSFELGSGETLGLCGPSGCGKTTVIWAVLGMLDRYGGYAQGEVIYRGDNLLGFAKKQWKALRWKKLALVPQSSMSALNPVFTIGRTFTETLKVHKCLGTDAIGRVGPLLGAVGLKAEILKRYPHELSGGMRQRISIALSMLLDPEVLILDEATTGLDVIIEADILKLLRTLQERSGFSILFVSHDKRIVGEFCHRRIEL